MPHPLRWGGWAVTPHDSPPPQHTEALASVRVAYTEGASADTTSVIL